MIFRRACAAEIEKIIVLQSDIFHMEQGIPEDDVEEVLARNPKKCREVMYSGFLIMNFIFPTFQPNFV